MSHITVLLNEAILGLNIKPNGVYVDGTFGRGGHSRAILEALGEKGRLIAVDRDPEAIKAGKILAEADPRFEIYHGEFSALENIITSQGLRGKVDGLLLDLGVSSPQLDVAERGFSFMKSGPLDMRMDTSQGISAQTWLASAREEDMAYVFKELGEERFARRIARAIVEKRGEMPIETTDHLVNIINDAVPKTEKHKHPATRTFQAIRIFINRELEELKLILDHSLTMLAVGGRLVVISFHSLEDRIVKRFLRFHSESQIPSYVPVRGHDESLRFKRIGKAIKASDDEVRQNPRSRSAVMRIGEKIL